MRPKNIKNTKVYNKRDNITGFTYEDILRKENEKAVKNGEMTEREAREDFERNLKLSKNKGGYLLKIGDGKVTTPGGWRKSSDNY